MSDTTRERFEKFVEETFEIPAEDLKKARYTDHEGTDGYKGMMSDEADTFLSGMYLTWLGAKEDNWTVGNDDHYDMSIHSNPDVAAWANFFLETFPYCGVDKGTMIGWFANVMMARHDFDSRNT